MTELSYFYKEMLEELENQRLTVVLVPAPEEMHSGHMIRTSEGRNPDWYSKLCYANMAFGKDRRRKEYAKINRNQVKRLLTRLANGQSVNSKFSDFLEKVALMKQEEIEDLMKRGNK